jgi:membrane protease YdiL (CAAX protease family)
MPNIFYNRNEGRLRAGWRILLQGLIFISGVILVNILTTIILTMFLQDPRAIMGMLGHPLVRSANAFGELASALLSYWIAARWLDRRPFAAFGFHFNQNWWIDLAFGLFLGGFLMVFIFFAELSAGWITITGTLQTGSVGSNFWGEIASYVILFLAVGISEEMLSRGYELRNLAEGFNFKALSPRTALLLAYLVSASMFGLFHLANANTTWVSTLNLIVAGLFLGLGFVLTGELAIPIGLHITWNFFQGNVFGFPVSGGGSNATFIAIQQGGPDAWTGGPFGPEAGLIGLVAIALGSLLIFLWVRWRYGAGKLKESLAVYRPKGSPPPGEMAGPSTPSLPEIPGA